MGRPSLVHTARPYIWVASIPYTKTNIRTLHTGETSSKSLNFVGTASTIEIMCGSLYERGCSRCDLETFIIIRNNLYLTSVHNLYEKP